MTNANDHSPHHSDAASQRSSSTSTESQRLRIDAGWIITMDQQLRVLEQHSLVVDNGLIIDCLPWATAEQRYSDMAAEDHRTAILMPGLINAHTHLPMSLLRGFADDKPLQDWLQNHIWPAEAAHMSTEFVRDGTRLALAESLLAGVTTVNDMYFFPNVTASVCHEVGMRATIGLIVIDFPTAWASSVDEYFNRGLALHDSWRDDKLIQTAFAPHAPYTVSKDPLERIAMLSAELSIPVHMHVHETAHEVEQFKQQHGVRPLQRLDDIGLLNADLIAVHLTQLTHREIERLAETGVHAIHCPESNLKLASGFCPMAELLDAGVTVAIGTDGAASNNDLDLLAELRTASFLSKALSAQATRLPALQALRLITIDAAKALGLNQQIGSLETGKSADCIVIEPDFGMIPIYNPAAQVVYTNSSQCVTDVWVAGRRLVANRQLQTLNAQAIRDSTQRWRNQIAS